MSFQCVIAASRRHLDDALRVRWSVFGEELGLVAGPKPAAPREVSSFDTLETTAHVVVYAGERPVATARLLLPNAEVARASGQRLGLDLEEKFDLSPLVAAGLVMAETTRFCILRDWRGSEVVAHLVNGLYQESRRLGVTHWVASANTETDSLEDARLAFLVAARQGLVSHRWHVEPREPPHAPPAPHAPFYTPEARRRAREQGLEGLRLPRTLSLFARKLGARFIGGPIYDAHFRRCSLPLVTVLDDVPASALARSEGASLAA
jgi:putative hemolysin